METTLLFQLTLTLQDWKHKDVDLLLSNLQTSKPLSRKPYHWAIPKNIQTIPRTAFWNFEGLRASGGGGGGSLNWKSEGMGGDTYICTTQGIRRYRGVLDLELSQGILRQDCIPWKCLFYGLNQFTNKAQTVDTSDDCGSRINDKHPLLSRKTNKTWVVDQAPEALMPQDIHFSLTKTVS